MRVILYFLIFSILLVSFVSAELNIGFDDPSLPQVNIKPPPAPIFDNNTAFVNRSDFWDNLDVPTDIPNSEFWYNQSTSTFNMWNTTWDNFYKADYQFLNNNFNGSGNFTTSGYVNTTNLKADHIAEKTIGHNIVFDNDIDMNENDIDNLGNLIHDGTVASDFVIQNEDLNKDIRFCVNDGGIVRDVITFKGATNSMQGDGTTASGLLSFSFGVNTTASGAGSFAFGVDTTASNDGSVCFGAGSTSSGIGSFASGYEIGALGGTAVFEATEFGSTAFGAAFSVGAGASQLLSQNWGSFAAGLAEKGTIRASGKGSVAMGYAGSGETLQATGTGSIAMGQAVQATANNAISFGNNFTNNVANSFAVGFGSPVFLVTKDEVNITGNLNVTGNFTGNQIYGEMWEQNDTTYKTNPIATQNVWINLSINSTDATAGQTLNGFRYIATTNTLIAQVEGLYKVDYSVSTGNDGNNQEYQFEITIKDVHQNSTGIHRKIGSAGDVGNAGTSGFIRLVVGDNINLQGRNNDGTGDLRVHSINVNLIRIGD